LLTYDQDATASTVHFREVKREAEAEPKTHNVVRDDLHLFEKTIADIFIADWLDRLEKRS
jgi:hypothetical protein